MAITDRKRLGLLLLWSILTLFIVFITIFIGFQFKGDEVGSDLIIGNIYTITPAMMAILFILIFKTENFGSFWKQFQYPGLKWLLFGLYYTIVVLSLTIITGFLVGGLTFNSDYTPFDEDFSGLQTSIPFLDILIFIVIIGFLLLFSPGGFIRIIGEEAGWRGYLMPESLKLRPRMSILVSSIFIGFIWFIYHLPYFTFLAPVSPENLIYFVLGSAGVFFGANWAMMWAYLKTKNLWPALSLHFTWNLISPLFTGNIYSRSTGWLNPSIDNIWLVNGEGLIGGFFHLLVGLIFLYLILKNQDKLSLKYESLEKVDSIDNSMKKMRIKTKSKN